MNKNTTFDQWVQSQQGTAYSSYYDFAKAAWEYAWEHQQLKIDILADSINEFKER